VGGRALPTLHLTWWALGLPWAVAHCLAGFGALLGWTTALHRRAGLPRLLAVAAWGVGVGWSWWVFINGPSLDAYRVWTTGLPP
jgi:hypothetical protein